MAVPYRLSGSSSGSLAFAALCVNAAAVLGILLVARRRGGTTLLLVTSVAQELARRCLTHGDVDGVLAATAVGLGVLPGHEELVCLRMRALAAAGDRSAVRREFAGYERAVLADPWSGGELADPVVALRNELLGAPG